MRATACAGAATVANVELERERANTERRNLVGGALQVLHASSHNRHVTTLGSKPEGNRSADTTAPTGYERDSITQTNVHRCPLFLRGVRQPKPPTSSLLGRLAHMNQRQPRRFRRSIDTYGDPDGADPARDVHQPPVNVH